MSLNQYMHDRNIYKHNPPNFIALSQDFPELKCFLNLDKDKKKGYLNFNNPNSIRVLTTCLLKKDFDLTISLPNDRLAPTLPLRLNYILWIDDLLNSFNPCKCSSILDIGTGSACIYPLLGVRINEKFDFLATEKDSKNYKYANENVEKNNLNARINVLLLPPNEDCLLPNLWSIKNDEFSDKCFASCMCNPPFYTTTEEQLYEEMKDAPIAFSCCGSHVETVSKDGDLGFANKLLNESLKLKMNFSWFTIMMGKKKSFGEFLKDLKGAGVKKICSSEFCQGRTTRWGVAWTFYEMENNVKLPISEFQKSKIKIKPKPVLMSLTLCNNINDALCKITTELTKINVNFETTENKELKIRAASCTWRNIRKRKRAQKNNSLSVNTLFTTLDCVVKIHKIDNEFVAHFYADSITEKEIINSLVVYLKRQFQ